MTDHPTRPRCRLFVQRLEDRTTPATAFALTASNQLVRFDTASPGASAAPVAVQGLGGADVLVALDYRPQNGLLYGLANSGGGLVRLYAISPTTGFANALSVPLAFTDAAGAPVPITGTEFDIDFNPTVDRVRVVTNTGFNFRMNPNTGQLVDGDGNPGNGVTPDSAINGNGVTGLQGTAYTNSSPNVAVTTQYGLDETTGRLFIQNPPNSGTQTLPLTLTFGAGLTVTDVSGFDILSDVTAATANTPVAAGVGYAFVTGTNGGGSVNGLAEINLTTGAINRVSPLGAGAGAIVSLAVQSRQPGSGAAGTPVVALAVGGTQLLRFNTATPGTVTTVTVTGVTAGETLVGLTARPATGVLYALGVNPTSDTATLYTVDPQGAGGTTVLTVVGTAGAITYRSLAGAAIDLPDPAAGYGLDFNPTVDRIRLVAGNGINARINPNDGTPVDADAAAGGAQPDTGANGLPAGATGLTAAAYTNSFGQNLATPTPTTQYTLEATSNSLFIQTPPNAGSQVNQRVVTLNGSPLDFTAVAGFDIDPTVRATGSGAPVAAGRATAALTVSGVTGLYLIDLATGAATFRGAIGTGGTAVAGLSVGDPAVGAGERVVAGAGPGLLASVTVLNAAGSVITTLTPFPLFAGGVSVATGDVTNDGVKDIVVAARAGGGPHVKVFDGVTFAEVRNFFAYDTVFTGGVNVGVGDVNDDGFADVITGAGPGGGPHVRVFSGANTAVVLRDFFPYTFAFRGGVSVAGGDVTGDGVDDVITGALAGGGPHVRVFNGTNLSVFREFFAYAGNFPGGVTVGAGDVNNDGRVDVLTAAGPGGGANVKVFDGVSGTEVKSFLAYDANFRGGATVSAADIDGDGVADIVSGAGRGGGPHVRAFRFTDLGEVLSVFPFDTSFTGGVDVG